MMRFWFMIVRSVNHIKFQLSRILIIQYVLFIKNMNTFENKILENYN